ncbi:hypothetical protein PAPYR_2697 [Paratrimastix pyriformis]|uniref:DIRP domain-containing protein n=1 Tax=Paratrimastix pyriformis TaxID=342808 RepID=A0ABQ8UTI6_9EUKA|nr:hypothetical protein PAPYR_2697 [Paratrimastix pyriformis]
MEHLNPISIWTPDALELVFQGLSEGCDPAIIADHIKKPPDAVAALARNFGGDALKHLTSAQFVSTALQFFAGTTSLAHVTPVRNSGVRTARRSLLGDLSPATPHSGDLPPLPPLTPPTPQPAPGVATAAFQETPQTISQANDFFRERYQRRLTPLARRWALSEFFTADLDGPFFGRNEFRECLGVLRQYGIEPGTLRYPRRRWIEVRRSFGKVRRFSRRFLQEEGARLQRHRLLARTTTARLAGLLRPQARVTVAHPWTAYLCEGTVLDSDLPHGRLLVRFDEGLPPVPPGENAFAIECLSASQLWQWSNDHPTVNAITPAVAANSSAPLPLSSSISTTSVATTARPQRLPRRPRKPPTPSDPLLTLTPYAVTSLPSCGPQWVSDVWTAAHPALLDQVPLSVQRLLLPSDVPSDSSATTTWALDSLEPLSGPIMEDALQLVSGALPLLPGATEVSNETRETVADCLAVLLHLYQVANCATDRVVAEQWLSPLLGRLGLGDGGKQTEEGAALVGACHELLGTLTKGPTVLVPTRTGKRQ